MIFSSTSCVDKTIALYCNLGWKSIFAKIRFWDAPYLEIERIVPKKGDILDLGCGEGLFSNFLAIASPGRKIFGIDVDKNRIRQADKGLKNTKFILGDVTKKSLPKADTIVMFHLLHHLNSYKDQEKVLKDAYRKINTGSSLIIVEAEPKFSLKFFSAWFTDHFLVPWIFEKKLYSPIFFRKSTNWKKLLKEVGFSSKVVPAEKNKPFSHIIIIAKKK